MSPPDPPNRGGSSARPTSAWGHEAARALDELKVELRELREKVAESGSSSRQNGWEIKQLQNDISGEDGVKSQIRSMREQVNAIREVLPDMKNVKTIAYSALGFIALVFMSLLTFKVGWK